MHGVVQRAAHPTPGQPQPPAWQIYGAWAFRSLAFWAAAAQTTARVAHTVLACPTWLQLPSALLRGVMLPYSVLLALSLEHWMFQWAVDDLMLVGGLGLLPALHERLLPVLAAAGWWPLELCRAWLELAVAAVSGAASCFG